MKFGREVMQMLLGGKRVTTDGLMSDDGYLALDAEGLLKYYYCDHGTRRAVQYGMNGYYELPTDSTDVPQCTCHGCKLGSNCVKAFEAGTGKGWPVDSKEQTNKVTPDIEYATVMNSTAHGLDNYVNKRIAQGWRPSGGACYVCYGGDDNGTFMQAMTREV